MSRELLLIGVNHEISEINSVCSELTTLDLRNKKVMLEVSNIPIPKDYSIINPSFYQFFSSVIDCLLSHGATPLAGDSEVLITQAQEEISWLSVHNPYRWLFDQFDIKCRQREPYFVHQLLEIQPDIGIFHHRHVANILPFLPVTTTTLYLGTHSP